jgi:hypothetical protein
LRRAAARLIGSWKYWCEIPSYLGKKEGGRVSQMNLQKKLTPLDNSGSGTPLQGSQRQIPSASRPPLLAKESNNSTNVYKKQCTMYAKYHEVCRRALTEYFNEDPDRNWNYIERLQKI